MKIHVLKHTQTYFYLYTVNKFYSRRITIPFEKNKLFNADKLAVLLIKKSVTNLFISFSFNGFVLFSCSAGSSGLKKKERRRKFAASNIGKLFCKFVRYYYKTSNDFTPFRNIILHLQAPISYFKLFIRSFFYYYRSLFYFFRYRYNGQLFRYNRKAKILFRIYNHIYNKLCLSIFQLRSYRKKIFFFSYSFFFIKKLINLIITYYKCNFSSFFKFYFFNAYFTHNKNYYLNYINNFSLSTFFFFLSRQKSLFCRAISIPPKYVIVHYLNNHLNIFSYLKYKHDFFSFFKNVFSFFNNSFFYTFFNNYELFKYDFYFYSIDLFFFKLDCNSTKNSEKRNFKLNSVINNEIINKFRVYFFFKRESFDFCFSFLSNLNMFFLFIKYSYLYTSFFSFYSIYLKTLLKKNINLDLNFFFFKYKYYFSIFIKRFYVFFIYTYLNNFYFSFNVYTYYRLFLNNVFSFVTSFFINSFYFSGKDLSLYKISFLDISFSCYFIFYNFLLYNFMCSFFFSPFSFLYSF